jgi:hypothetical protein
MLGASGAISAVLGAFLVLYSHARIKTLVLVFFADPRLGLPGRLVLHRLLEAHSALVTPSVDGSGVAFFAPSAGSCLVAAGLLDAERSDPNRTGAPRSGRSNTLKVLPCCRSILYAVVTGGALVIGAALGCFRTPPKQVTAGSRVPRAR